MPEGYSQRGFARYATFTTERGTDVSVYESSAADAPHVWVSLDGECHLRSEPRPCPGVECGIASGHAAAHLNVENARRVRDALDEWLTAFTSKGQRT